MILSRRTWLACYSPPGGIPSIGRTTGAHRQTLSHRFSQDSRSASDSRKRARSGEWKVTDFQAHERAYQIPRLHRSKETARKRTSQPVSFVDAVQRSTREKPLNVAVLGAQTPRENFPRATTGGGRETEIQHSLAGLRRALLWFADFWSLYPTGDVKCALLAPPRAVPGERRYARRAERGDVPSRDRQPGLRRVRLTGGASLTFLWDACLTPRPAKAINLPLVIG